MSAKLPHFKHVISPGGADTVSVFPCSGYDRAFTNTCHLLQQTVSGLECFFLAMALHTEEQKKAQAEIDKVIGLGRLPTLRDGECLPYTNALITEAQRRYPFAMLGNLSFTTRCGWLFTMKIIKNQVSLMPRERTMSTRDTSSRKALLSSRMCGESKISVNCSVCSCVALTLIFQAISEGPEGVS